MGKKKKNMTQIEELKERIKKENKLLTKKEKDNYLRQLFGEHGEPFLFKLLIEDAIITGELKILKDWLEREQEIINIIDNKIDEEEGNYNLTKHTDELNHLNIYFRGLKKLKDLKEEIKK